MIDARRIAPFLLLALAFSVPLACGSKPDAKASFSLGGDGGTASNGQPCAPGQPCPPPQNCAPGQPCPPAPMNCAPGQPCPPPQNCAPGQPCLPAPQPSTAPLGS